MGVMWGARTGQVRWRPLEGKEVAEVAEEARGGRGEGGDPIKGERHPRN